MLGRWYDVTERPLASSAADKSGCGAMAYRRFFRSVPENRRRRAKCSRSGWTCGNSTRNALSSHSSTRVLTRRAGLPFNLAQLYMRMAEGTRDGKSVGSDFDVAVQRHQLLDVIQKASDTGIRQILWRLSSDRLTTCSPAVSKPW